MKTQPSREDAMDALIDDWARDKTPLARKIVVAATRADVAELNAALRARLVEAGAIDDPRGVDVEIRRRDESTDMRRFAPGDRVGFSMNDRELGVANGVAGTLRGIDAGPGGPTLRVELDEPNARGDRMVSIPASFAMFDHAYATTNHRAQGLTRDSAYVFVNSAMCDREWIYVAASRSRFSTTLYVDASSFASVDAESHREERRAAPTRAEIVESLATRMRRSRAKGTSLDFESPDISLPAATRVPAIGRFGTPAAASALMSAFARPSAAIAARLLDRLRSRTALARRASATQPQLAR